MVLRFPPFTIISPEVKYGLPILDKVNVPSPVEAIVKRRFTWVKFPARLGELVCKGLFQVKLLNPPDGAEATGFVVEPAHPDTRQVAPGDELSQVALGMVPPFIACS